MSDSMIVEGLSRLAASVGGLPLIGSKQVAGAFPATKAGREAAACCTRDALVRALPAAQEGRNATEWYTLSESGIRWLKQQSSAKGVLQQIAQAIETREQGLMELQAQVRNQAEQARQLRMLIQELAEQAREQQPAVDATTIEDTTILSELRVWHRKQPLKDCDLPTLYQSVRMHLPQFAESIGRFHDACRRLAEKRRLFLHPWTGPLYELPEPTLALLWGHEIAYYASLADAASLEDDEARPAGYVVALN